MAVVTSGIWAIDIGANSLKAVHMRSGQNGPEVIGFDYVEHSRMLCVGHLSEDQKQQIVSETMHKFAERNNIGTDEVAVQSRVKAVLYDSSSSRRWNRRAF
jgi:hypothetical protein